MAAAEHAARVEKGSNPHKYSRKFANLVTEHLKDHPGTTRDAANMHVAGTKKGKLNRRELFFNGWRTPPGHGRCRGISGRQWQWSGTIENDPTETLAAKFAVMHNRRRPQM